MIGMSQTIFVKAVSLCFAFMLFGRCRCVESQVAAQSLRPSDNLRDGLKSPVLQAITHVTVINPSVGSDERHDMTILIQDSMIVSVQESAEARIPSGTQIHDERGRYAIPGLWDVHVHLTQVGPRAFPLLLANGVTSVRDMGSDLIEIRQWQEARVQGALIPRILTPGPKLDGMTYEDGLHAPYRPDRFVVTSPETARAIVDALKTAKVDFIKVHNGMNPQIYEAIAKEAHRVGLPFDGHLPMEGPLAAVAAGQRTLEHGQRMLLCSDVDWRKIRSETC